MAAGAPTNGHRLFVKQVNLLEMHRRIDELIAQGPVGDDFIFNEDIVCSLHRIAMRELLDAPGEYRRHNVEITYADHKPPRWETVPTFMKDFVCYVNKHWSDRHMVHLAAFSMWRLCWIHPFPNGNGRTARGVSYLVLSARYGGHLPPKNSIIEQIVNDKKTLGIDAPYYRALGASDKKHKNCETECSACEGECTCSNQMEAMVLDHFKRQLTANL
jgi:Fic family protein